jgi:DNA/RNA endonuclease YhcR with UshA esterase domain
MSAGRLPSKFTNRNSREGLLYMKRILAVALLIAAFFTVPGLYAQDDQEEDRPARKPQSELAAKDKSFAKIASDAPEVKAAKKADDLETAIGLVGKTAAFIGTVDRTFTPRGNGMVLINFARDYKTAIVGVVRAADFSKFPNLNTLKGKKVLITGKVEEYKGKPQVELVRLESIKLVQ